MTRALLSFRLAVLAAIAVEHLWLARWVGPDVEARYLPVLTGQRLGHIERVEDGRRACFTWYFDKARPARAIDAGWTLRAGGRLFPYQRVETVADSWEVGAGLVLRPVRPAHWSRKCIDIPEVLRGEPFRITGFVEFRTDATSRWWAIRQDTAEGDVP